MPKRSRTTEDANEAAHRIISRVIELTEGTPPEPAPKPKAAKKNPAAVALGRKGGLKGGHARAAKLSPEERAESARKAARARWKPAEPPQD